MYYKIITQEGGYLNSYKTLTEAFEENERLKRIHPKWKTMVVPAEGE